MITPIIKTLLFRFFWSALWGMGWGMLLDGGMPDITHMSMGWSVALLLFLLAFACLLADLLALLAQRQHMPKEHAEQTAHTAGAGARTPFFILQKGVTARCTAFCEEWVATHSETQEKTMPVPKNTLPLTGLDWRQAIERYVPRIVVCQRCHTHCTTGVERAERLCTFHLYACGLGMQMDASHRRLVALLERRVAFLQAHPDLPSL